MSTPVNTDPKVMAAWHTHQYKYLFPDTIRDGFWKSGPNKLTHKMKKAFGVTSGIKYKPEETNQSINIYTEDAHHRDEFIRLCRKFDSKERTGANRVELSNRIRDEAVLALQGFHDHGSLHIEKFYDRNRPRHERIAAYRRWSRSLDHSMDIYSKLTPITGDKFDRLTRDMENAQTRIRNDAIEELVMSDPSVIRAQEQERLGQITHHYVDSITDQIRMRATAEVMLHSIKRINPVPSDTQQLELVGDDAGGTISILPLQRFNANNRSYNCTRVVPATLGVVFGAKLKAVAAIDDHDEDLEIRTQWEQAYEEVYGGKFTPMRSFEELFDVLENSPPGTTGIIYNQWKYKGFAHVSVVANINGVACMVEGQSAHMVMRNPQTREFESHKLIDGQVQISRYNPNLLDNIEVLTVGRAQGVTERQRATSVIEKLHDKFFSMRDVKLDLSSPEQPKQYFVPYEKGPGIKPDPNRFIR